MVKVTKMCSGTVWYNSFCWNVSHCVVLCLYILYMGFCGNGYHPFSKWMILFRGLNCPSRISFVEVSERGLRRLSVVLAIHMWHSVKTNGKHLKDNLSPRVSCCWATSRGLVSVHVNVYSANRIDVASSKRTCFAHYIGCWNWLYFTAIWAINAKYLYKTPKFWPLWHKIGTSFSEES